MKPNPPPRDIKYDADKVTSDAQNYLDKFKMLMKDVVEDVFVVIDSDEDNPYPIWCKFNGNHLEK